MHALGPGLLIYEVQQSSDLTYRVYDWDRPVTGTRKLHIQESMEVFGPGLRREISCQPTPILLIGRQKLISCKYCQPGIDWRLAPDRPRSTCRGKSFSVVTALNGPIMVHSEDCSYQLSALERY